MGKVGRRGLVAGLGLALAAPMTMFGTTAAAEPAGGAGPSFTAQASRAGELRAGAQALRAAPAGTYTAVVDRRSGRSAVVDTSLLELGTLVATTADYTDLSWASDPAASAYRVFRDGRLIANGPATQLRDRGVRAGTTPTYRIEKVAAPGRTLSGVTSIGVLARVPQRGVSTTAAARSATQQAARVETYGSWFKWNTFIPQSKIDAPSAGCDYGSGYQFHGDGRSWSSSSSASRTTLTANLRWDRSDPRLLGSSKRVGETIVYRKSTGAVVARRTASSADLWVKELGSDSDQVDLRFSVQARNPFCSLGSIAGAFTVNAYKNGNWAIRSGSHRQMPNWEVYAGWISGPSTTVYRRSYASALCLVQMACPEAQMGGYTGDY